MLFLQIFNSPIWRIKMWFNCTLLDLTLPKSTSSRLLSHCKATICSHVAFSLVAFDFQEWLCACWEKCCLNISLYKYGKWFVMAPESSSEFYIKSSPIISMFGLSLCHRIFSTHKESYTIKDTLFSKFSTVLTIILQKHKEVSKTIWIETIFGKSCIYMPDS